MEVFFGLGTAVAGIFVTVLLSGVLSGIVAYGVIEIWRREKIQHQSIEEMLNTERFYSKTEEYREMPRYSELSEILDLYRSDFYSLPYRQLCGLLAARVSADVSANASGDKPSALTDLLASRMASWRQFEPWSPDYFRKTAEQALAFIDKLQVRLSHAVAKDAAVISGITVALIFVALLFPLTRSLMFFSEQNSIVIRSGGFVLAFFVAGLVLIILAFGSLIVANLTFRWIDRFASAR